MYGQLASTASADRRKILAGKRGIALSVLACLGILLVAGLKISRISHRVAHEIKWEDRDAERSNHDLVASLLEHPEQAKDMMLTGSQGRVMYKVPLGDSDWATMSADVVKRAQEQGYSLDGNNPTEPDDDGVIRIRLLAAEKGWYVELSHQTGSAHKPEFDYFFLSVMKEMD